jgi:hypothetical protein
MPGGQAVDTLNYKTGENIKTYWGVEPRLSMRFKVDKQSSFKSGSNHEPTIHVHLVSSVYYHSAY